MFPAGAAWWQNAGPFATAEPWQSPRPAVVSWPVPMPGSWAAQPQFMAPWGEQPWAAAPWTAPPWSQPWSAQPLAPPPWAPPGQGPPPGRGRGPWRSVTPHVHRVCGLTSFDAGHLHRHDVVTGSAIAQGDSHVHRFEGITSTDNGHAHWYGGITGPAFPSLFWGGHYHQYRTEVVPSDTPRRHAHILSGRTMGHDSPA